MNSKNSQDQAGAKQKKKEKRSYLLSLSAATLFVVLAFTLSPFFRSNSVVTFFTAFLIGLSILFLSTWVLSFYQRSSLMPHLSQNDKEQFQRNRLKSTLIIVSFTAGLTFFLIGYNSHSGTASFHSSLPEMFIFSLIFSMALYFYLSWLLTFTRFKSLLINNKSTANNSQLSNFSENEQYEYDYVPGPLSLDARWNSLRAIDPFYKTTGHIPNTHHLEP